MIHRTYHTSDLSIQDANGKWSIGVSASDVIELVFNSDAGAYVSSEATITRCDTLTVLVAADYLESDELEDSVAITVSGLTRGYAYEVAVTFIYDDDTTATGTFIIECVA